MTAALALAQHFTARGFATIPILRGTKLAACKWTKFQNVGPSEAQLPGLFGRDDLEVALMCGAASDNLLVFDADSAAMVTQVRDALGNPKTPITGTRRGAHIFVHTPVPVKSTKIPDLCVRGQGNYVLAPGALHPSGMRYYFLQESDTVFYLPSLDSIPWLPLEPAPALKKFQRPPDMPLLAYQVLRGYVTPETHPQYATRSECEAAAVTSLINARWTFERVLDAFRRFAHAETKYKTKCERDVLAADDWLRLTFDECYEFAHTHESEASQTIHRLRSWALGRAWEGHTGAYDRAVYLAHLDLAGRAVKTTYGASVRDLAERALISPRAVSSANKRLMAEQLLKVHIPAVFTFADVWRLEQAFVPKLHTPTPLNVEEVCNFGTISAEHVHFARETAHDVFSWEGLGKAAAHVWHALLDEQWQSNRAIAEATGRGKTTVWRALTVMFDLGMVERRGSGNRSEWRRNGDVDLQQVALSLGVAGKGAAQKVKHIADRKAHTARLLSQAQPRLFDDMVKKGDPQ